MSNLPEGWERDLWAYFIRRDGMRLDYDWTKEEWVAWSVGGEPVGTWLRGDAHAAMLALNKKYPLEVRDGE